MGDPSAVARMPEHLDVFRAAGDGRVYTSWWHDGTEWSNWRPIGGFFPPGAQVASVARLRDNLDLFICGNDGRVYTSWWFNGVDWSGVNDNWRSIGGVFPPGAPVSAVARTGENLDLFICGNDGRVYTSWWFNGADWSGVNDNWRSIGGFFPAGAPVSAVARQPDHLDLFICGNDGRVYTSWWHAGSDWSGIADNWRSIGGFFPPGARVTAVARQPDQLDLFVGGNDGRIYTSWWHAGSDWSGINDNWRPIGGFFPVGAPVAAVARHPDHLDLFIRGNDDQIWSEWWHMGSEWSGIADNWFSVPPSIRLGFDMELQQQTNWCWAATSKSVAAYYDPATTWTQCAIADGEKGQTNCCTNGSSAACNAYGTLDTSLTRVGHFDHAVNGAASYGDVLAQMRIGRPVGVRTAWSGGGAHFVAIIGTLPGNLYAVDDPISGKSDVTESSFKTMYLNSGTWTHTFYTR
jgi:Papain-like cysteine protease AvrRpt2